MGGAGRVIDRWEVPWDNPSSDQLARPVGNDCLGSGNPSLYLRYLQSVWRQEAVEKEPH